MDLFKHHTRFEHLCLYKTVYSLSEDCTQNTQRQYIHYVTTQTISNTKGFIPTQMKVGHPYSKSSVGKGLSTLALSLALSL